MRTSKPPAPKPTSPLALVTARIPSDIMRAFKLRAVQDDVTMREWLTQAIREKLAKKAKA